MHKQKGRATSSSNISYGPSRFHLVLLVLLFLEKVLTLFGNLIYLHKLNYGATWYQQNMYRNVYHRPQ